MNDSKFIKDFYRITGENITIKNFLINFVRKHEIRYLYFYRNKTKNVINKIIFRKMSLKYGLELLSLNIGEGLFLGHSFNITINPNATIGKNCNIHKGVTIGQENRGKRKGTPRIGDEVWIGINSTIVGNIKIGNDVLIAPNSYVNTNIPSHSIVIGNPCHIYKCDEATKGYINRKI